MTSLSRGAQSSRSGMSCDRDRRFLDGGGVGLKIIGDAVQGAAIGRAGSVMNFAHACLACCCDQSW